MTTTTRKLSNKRKWGYSFGIFADTMGYSMFYSFFFTFLTSVVGVNAAVAGTISSIGILWDGITDPVVGYLADQKPHRRRKLIFWTSFPYAISVVLTFVAVDFGSVGNAVYYTLCALSFWLFYTTVCVPYYSSVPELTKDYDEQTEVRSFSAWINSFANLITLSCPMLLVNFFGTWTHNTGAGWTLTAALFAVIIIAAATICSFTLKGAEKEQPEAQEKAVEKKSLGTICVDLIKTFIKVLSLKQVLILFTAILFCNIYRGFTSTGFTTFMIYGMGWGEANISLCYAIMMASWLIYFPVLNLACKKWDRKACLIGGALITFAGRTAIGFLPFATTTAGCYINVFLSNFLQCSYLALIFALPYDLAELYEFKNNGAQAASTIQSIPLMAQKIGSALGALVWGIALDSFGFDGTAAVQTAAATDGHATVMLSPYYTPEMTIDQMQDPKVNYQTDAWIDPGCAQNPAAYGSFPRFLRLGREKTDMRLEDVVHKMTGKTARRFDLRHRGFLKNGYYADITVFDPENVRETATAKDPSGKPEGIKKVFVNGQLVVDEGKVKDVKAGMTI